MKNRIVAVVLIVCILALFGCEAKRDSHSDIINYGQWKDSTNSILTDSFCKSLPSSQKVREYGKHYYFKREQALLGDENFVIRVILQFDNKAIYERELINHTKDYWPFMLESDSATQYLIQGSSEAIQDYLDDEVLDGMFYNFEIVSTNADDYSISFISAHVWDYYTDPILSEYLQQVSETLGNNRM